MKARDFFTHIAEKAGFDIAEKSFTEFLTANDKLEIPDSLASEVQGKLMNEDDAKKSSTIAGHFKSQTLSGVDTELERLLTELQLDDETKGTIKSEKSTFKRVPLLIQKVKELEAKKADAGKGDKAELVKKIGELNAEILKIEDKWKNTLTAKEQEFNSQIEDFALRSYFAQKNYANDKISKNTHVKTAIAEIQERLNGKAKILRDGNNFKLVSWDNPDLPYRENHKDIPFDSFVDKTLGEVGMLKVSEPARPGNPPTPPVQGLADHDQQALQMVKELSAKQLATRTNGSH